MKYKWLNQKNNSKIIVFFNGWGMDESVVNHLNSETYDIVMFYDYNDLNTDFDFKIINSYKQKHLIAWSMGVMIATLFNQGYDTKTAINGTIFPINNEYGIPERIYDLTIKGFNEKGAKRFIKNMFLEEPPFIEIKRELENQKDELVALKKYKGNENFKYTRVILSSDDKIIPTKNQINYWKIEPNIISGHCPFFQLKSWSELL